MSFQVQRPDTLPGAALDALLASGWYRMRQTMFTCRYLLGAHGLHTAIWTRLSLAQHTFRPSLRKLMRRVERDYRVRVRPFELTPEHEELYTRYRAHVGGERSDNLAGVLYDEGESLDRFDSWEVSIEDKLGRQVAYSVFDRGQFALQSILGVYDPDHARDSLGFATLLFEVRWGQREGLRHHYSGYVVPGVDAFDYKTRVGELEAWNPDTGLWRPLTQRDPTTLPAQRMLARLQELVDRLADHGVNAQLRCHPPYRLVQAQRLLDWSVGLPLVVDCGPLRGRRQRVIATHDPVQGRYQIDACRPNRDLSELLAGDSVPRAGPPPEWRLLVRVRRLGELASVDETAARILEHIRL